MMRSDMPKQIMAYRNGGGISSLATVPMETNISGEPHQLSYITPFEANLLRGLGGSGTPGPGGVPQYAGVYETLFGKPFSDTAVGQALGMEHSTGALPASASAVDTSSAAGVAAASGPTSAQQNLANLQSASKRRKKKRKQRAAAAAAAAAAAEQAAAANTAVDQGVGSLDTNVGLTDSERYNGFIENILGRDDLTDLEKLEFGTQTAEQLGVVGGPGHQALIDNVLNTALDVNAGLTDQEMLGYLNAAGDASGVYETGLIDTLTSNISAAEQLAAEQAAAEAAAAAQAQADQLAAEQAAAAAAQAEQEAAAAAAAAAAQAQADQLAAAAAAANQFSLSGAGSGAGYGTYNTNSITSGQPITTSINYAPIVPSSNVNTAGIAGLPSTGMSNIQPYTFTAYTPGAYTPAVNPLVLPPLG
jgi:FKBP-type peptidyl-prolyl cis-trans isomerase